MQTPQTYRSLFFLLLLSIAFLAGCSQQEDQPKAKQTVVGGDIREEAPSKTDMPSFLEKYNANIQAVYAAVPDHAQMLEYIPCYCGCGESAGHMNNLDCFIHDMRPDGSLVWDSHGTTCNVCLYIAAESIKMESEGKTVKEIREYIDEKYKDGFAKPTPTPMPPAS